jgi:hypothetical protein
MGIGLPTYMVIGIYSTFGNEFAKALGITEDVQAGTCVLYTYIGVVTGDFFSGILSQWLQIAAEGDIAVNDADDARRRCLAAFRGNQFGYHTLYLLYVARLLDWLHRNVPHHHRRAVRYQSARDGYHFRGQQCASHRAAYIAIVPIPEKGFRRTSFRRNCGGDLCFSLALAIALADGRNLRERAGLRRRTDRLVRRVFCQKSAYRELGIPKVW